MQELVKKSLIEKGEEIESIRINQGTTYEGSSAIRSALPGLSILSDELKKSSYEDSRVKQLRKIINSVEKISQAFYDTEQTELERSSAILLKTCLELFLIWGMDSSDLLKTLLSE